MWYMVMLMSHPAWEAKHHPGPELSFQSFLSKTELPQLKLSWNSTSSLGKWEVRQVCQGIQENGLVILLFLAGIINVTTSSCLLTHSDTLSDTSRSSLSLTQIRWNRDPEPFCQELAVIGDWLLCLHPELALPLTHTGGRKRAPFPESQAVPSVPYPSL